MNETKTEVGVSLKIIYEELSGDLKYGDIKHSKDGSQEYYDFYNEQGLSCMDGEICELLSHEDDVYLLKNQNGDVDTTFKLSEEEYHTGCIRVNQL